MNKQIRTKLQFILGAILLVTFAVAGCNNKGDADSAAKDSVTKPPPPQPIKDSMDTANEAPTPDGT